MAIKEKKLVRSIGILGSTLLILNGIVGAGIFALPATIAPLAGILSPWLFLAVAFLIITLVLTFAELSSYFKESGGPVLYTTEAFGPLAGFSTGWLYYLSRATAFAGNTHIMAIYLGALWPWFDTGTGRIFVVIAVCGGLTLVNLLGTKNSIRTLMVLSFFKVVPLLVLILLGTQYISPEILFPKDMPTIDDFGRVTLLLLYAYVGFETALITAGETENPKDTIPKALIWTVIAMGILYFLIMLVYVSMFPGTDNNGATLVEVGRQMAGPIGAVTITLAAIFSINGNLSSTMIAAPRLTLSLSEQRLLPKWFKTLHAKNASPVNSIIFFGVLCMALALSGSFILLAISTSLSRLITYLACILALPVIKNRANPETVAASFKIKGGYIIPALAFILCIWAASHSSYQSWQLVIGLLIFGLIPYAIEQRRLKRKMET